MKTHELITALVKLIVEHPEAANQEVSTEGCDTDGSNPDGCGGFFVNGARVENGGVLLVEEEQK